MSDFRFNRERHEYWLGKRQIPSVTGIINACGLIYQADKEALERGKFVHLCCELLNRGTLDWQTIDYRLAGYVESYQKALYALGFKVAGVEQSNYSSLLLYAGTYDVSYKNGFIVDLKTGSRSPWHRAQLGAYWNLNGQNGFGIGTLYLQEDASIARLVEYNPCEAWQEFQVCLNFYRLKERYGKLNNNHDSRLD